MNVFPGPQFDGLREYLRELIHEVVENKLYQYLAERHFRQAVVTTVGEEHELARRDRIKLMIETNVRVQIGNRARAEGEIDYVLFAYPCTELVQRGTPRIPRDWPARWRKAGGRFIGNRMIARRDADVWWKISAFNLPFPPFDCDDWMARRDVRRDECVSLGLLREGDRVARTCVVIPRSLFYFDTLPPGPFAKSLPDGCGIHRADPQLSPGERQVRAIVERMTPEERAELDRELDTSAEREFLDRTQAEHEARHNVNAPDRIARMAKAQAEHAARMKAIADEFAREEAQRTLAAKELRERFDKLSPNQRAELERKWKE